MALSTFDRSAPPLFNQGPSALSRLIMLAALALFMMVADARFHLMGPLRAVVATALFPLQWLVLQPIRGAQFGADYFVDLRRAQADEKAARQTLAAQSARAAQVEWLTLENARLRELLALSRRDALQGHAAEVLYDATDPYARRIVINRGGQHGVRHGAPVLDGYGVLGQVTRVYPLVSEVTLLIDRDQAIPLLNARNGVRGVAYGDPTVGEGALDLRYMPAATDVREGDEWITSGVDGVYPPGLPVARTASVARRSDSAFARIQLSPHAQGLRARYVMVLTPGHGVQPPDPASELALPPLARAGVAAASAAPAASAPSASAPASARVTPRRAPRVRAAAGAGGAR